ncbi:group 1 truncated hemoglobin [Aliikangiella marina]|uniref:Group 1 truncated hemoglobin n=1 Tax=Aliikangiella marina TaxID=1712262 RepID=A0A545T4D0_9GAMM|nr:group 1 truncated hemoglobin [Aliikangiella marina]TQV72084.1 group 1 truncated hemoglobin [Aliikangiella marina]
MALSLPNSHEHGENNLFTRIGGEAAVEAAVNIFYEKFLDNPEINSFFDSTSVVDQIEKMRVFLRLIMQENTQYDRDLVRKAHAPLLERGLNDHHFDIFIELMEESLQELEIPKEIIGEFMLIAETYRDDVLVR